MQIPGLEQIPPTLGAGVAGAVTGALTMQGTPFQRAAAGVAGAFCAIYVGPIAAPFVFAALEAFDKAVLGDVVTIDLIHVASFTGFLLGVAGMSVPGIVQGVLRAGGKRAEKIVGGK